MKSRLFLVAVMFTASLSVQPTAVSAADPPKILFLTQSKGYTHGSVRRKGNDSATRAPAELAMMQLAKDSGKFTVYCSQNAEADMTKENLQKFDIVAFYTSGDLPIGDEDLEYFLNDWLHQKGHGFIGFHSASDTYKKHKPYSDLISGIFIGHPWKAKSTITAKVHDTNHPTMKPFGESFVHQDEIYEYKNWQPEKCHVLMSIDMEHTEIKKPYQVPIAWCKQIGEGRMFYTNLGHREETWQNEKFLESVVAAVDWVAGKIDGDATPNPEVSKQQQADSEKAANEKEPVAK